MASRTTAWLFGEEYVLYLGEEYVLYPKKKGEKRKGSWPSTLTPKTRLDINRGFRTRHRWHTDGFRTNETFRDISTDERNFRGAQVQTICGTTNERNFSGHKYGRTKFSWGTSTDDLRDDERTKFSLDTSTDDLRDTMGTNEIFAGHKYGRFIGRKTDTIVGHNDRRLRGTYRQTTSWKWMMVSSMPELLKMVWRATSTVALLSVPN